MWLLAQTIVLPRFLVFPLAPLQEGAPEDEYSAKFVLLREPNAPKLSFYAVPPSTFEDEEGGEDDEEGAGGDGEGDADEEAAAAWEGAKQAAGGQ